MKRIEPQHTVATKLVTPLGTIRLAASPRGLRRIDFLTPRQLANPLPRSRRDGSTRLTASSGAKPAARQARGHLQAAIRQLRHYFAGRRSAFDLPLDLEGTAHQRRVWHALRRIPFGHTLSYGAVARQLGLPGAARAVGRACSTNPVPVVVPCHRVIGGDGALHGYNGGLWRKRVLLELERGQRGGAKGRRYGLKF